MTADAGFARNDGQCKKMSEMKADARICRLDGGNDGRCKDGRCKNMPEIKADARIGRKDGRCKNMPEMTADARICR